MSRTCFQEADKKLLLISCKRIPLFPLVVMGGFQLLEHIIDGVDSYIIIIDRHLKDLMQHIMDILNGSHLHYLAVCQSVIKPAYIGFLDLSDSVLPEGLHNK